MTGKPATLSDTAQTVLAAAAARADRLAVAPARLPRAACSAVARTLLRAGYLERTEAEQAALWYPEPGRVVSLRVTHAGLRAIGLGLERDETDLTTPKAPPVVGQGTPTTAAVPEATSEPVPAVDAAQSAPEAPVMEGDSGTSAEHADKELALPPAVGRDARTNLRRVADAVVQAWDDEASQRAGQPEAVVRLRALLARTTATRAGSAAPRRPREGTKQAQVLAPLAGPGASGPQIAEAAD